MLDHFVHPGQPCHEMIDIMESLGTEHTLNQPKSYRRGLISAYGVELAPKT